ncbi:helix-turn-helix domain-containing protein [Amycolatopsis palatopharyngis]|uniref:helix-turn-helix domain-containing protein n=1 Tax=Amycolatopsis palatopharyngis TaxID=187982 RepID=UPI0013BEA0B0|nr:helix-turn-helix transcriptional regulator [Amycolatopsis palatopharyngis]
MPYASPQLKLARQASKRTVRKLAEMVDGLSHRHLSNVETGKYQMKIEDFHCIAEILDVDVWSLVSADDPAHPTQHQAGAA